MDKRKLADGSTLEEVDITPAMAAVWLKNLHPNQRPLRKPHVSRLARAMKQGKWKATGAGFKFDKRSGSGADRMIDGQHRCMAIIDSGVTLKAQALIRVPDKDAILYIDSSGAPRSLRDMRASAGLTHVIQNLAAALAIEATALKSPPAFDWVARRELSPVESNECVDSYPHLNSLIRICKMSLRKPTVGILAGMAYCVRRNRKDAVGFFAAALACEEFVGEYEAPQAKKLYLWMEAHKPGQHGQGFTGGYKGMERQIVAAVESFNAWVNGDEWKNLQGRAANRALPKVAK